MTLDKEAIQKRAAWATSGVVSKYPEIARAEARAGSFQYIHDCTKDRVELLDALDATEAERDMLRSELARFQRVDVGEEVRRHERLHVEMTSVLKTSPRFVALELTHDLRGELIGLVRQQQAEIEGLKRDRDSACAQANAWVDEHRDETIQLTGWKAGVVAERDALHAELVNVRAALGQMAAERNRLRDLVKSYEDADTKPVPQVELCGLCRQPALCNCDPMTWLTASEVSAKHVAAAALGRSDAQADLERRSPRNVQATLKDENPDMAAYHSGFDAAHWAPTEWLKS